MGRINREEFIGILGNLNVAMMNAAESGDYELLERLVIEKNTYIEAWPIKEILDCETSSKEISIPEKRRVMFKIKKP